MSDLHAVLAELTEPAALAGVALGSDTVDEELFGIADSDGTVDAAAQPRSTAAITVGFELVVDGSVVSLTRALPGWTVTRSLDAQLQTWTISFALNDAEGQFGNPFTHSGPALCKKTVTLRGIYLTSTGLHRIPLITDGIADVTTRSVAVGSPSVEEFSGVDAGGRYDRKTVTMVLKPGHGFTRGGVVQKIAAKAGMLQTNVDPSGASCKKEVQLVDSDWLSVAAEMMEVEGRTLVWDRDGLLSNPRTSRPESDEATAWTFDERDFDAAAGIRIQHSADVLTDLTLTTWEQNLGSDECPPEEQETESEEQAIYKPLQETYQQVGSIADSWVFNAVTPAPGEAELRPVKVVRHETIKRCGTLVWERTREWGWKNWIAPRMKWDWVWPTTPAEYGFLPQTCYTSDNDEEGQSQGYEYEKEQWSLLGITEVWHFYNWRGYSRGWMQTPAQTTFAGTSGLEYHAWAALSLTSIQSGEPGEPGGVPRGRCNPLGSYLGSVTAQMAPKFARAAAHTPGNDDEGGLDVGTYWLGGAQDCVSNSYPYSPYNGLWWSVPMNTPGLSSGGIEKVVPVALTVTAQIDREGRGTVTEEVSAHYGWMVLPGSGHTFADGMNSRYDTEKFWLVGTELVTYETTGEGENVRTAVTRDHDGNVIGTFRETGEGAGPQLQMLDLPERDSSEYESPEQEEELAQPARRSDTKQIKVQVVAEGLEECHEKSELKTEVEWAETEEELIAVGQRMVEDSAAATVNATLAGCNFFVEPGQKHRWVVTVAGLDHDVRLRSVTWSTDGLRITTALEGKAYGW